MARIEHDAFVPLAVNLPVGHSMRADHDCMGVSQGTLMISREVGKLSAYCFRCHEHGSQILTENFQEKLDRLNHERAADAEAVASVALPSPQVHELADWPRDAALWLYKSGFSPSMIEKLGAYYCPSLGRVVLPVMEGGVPVFWQARSVNRKPKILSPRAPRGGLVAKFGVGDTVVLCEDILSAFKVGQVTEAWALMGTGLLPHPLAELMYRKPTVLVWLDSDKPGQDGATKIMKTLRAYGLTVRNIITPKDPKLYDRKFIKETIHA